MGCMMECMRGGVMKVSCMTDGTQCHREHVNTHRSHQVSEEPVKAILPHPFAALLQTMIEGMRCTREGLPPLLRLLVTGMPPLILKLTYLSPDVYDELPIPRNQIECVPVSILGYLLYIAVLLI